MSDDKMREAFEALENYRRSYDELYAILGRLLDSAEGEGEPVDMDEMWGVFNSAPGPVFWDKIETAIEQAAQRQGGEAVAWMRSDGHVLTTEQLGRLKRKGGPDNQARERYSTPLYTAPQPAVPEGWKLVPVHADESMIRIGKRARKEEFTFQADPDINVQQIWKAMCARAPEPPQPQPNWAPYLMLAEFGRQCFQAATDEGGGDIEWDQGFDIAQEVGLLVPEQRDEPCYAEGGHCMCDDVGADFPTTCYRPTEKLNGILFHEIKRPEPKEDRNSVLWEAQYEGRFLNPEPPEDT